MITLTILFVIQIASLFYAIRLTAVFYFKLGVLDLVYSYNIRNPLNRKWCAWSEIWDKLPSDRKLMWSFKTLRLKDYFSEEVLNELYSR